MTTLLLLLYVCAVAVSLAFSCLVVFGCLMACRLMWEIIWG